MPSTTVLCLFYKPATKVEGSVCDECLQVCDGLEDSFEFCYNVLIGTSLYVLKPRRDGRQRQ